MNACTYEVPIKVTIALGLGEEEKY